MKEYRYRFGFSKKGAISFVSHLDMLRVFQSALRRVNLPISYSQGFNPHQKMGFAFPLTTGFEGENELVELEFDRGIDIAETIVTLNRVLPEGLLMFHGEKLGESEQSAASRVCAAEYRVVFPDSSLSRETLADITELIMSAEPGTLVVTKETKKGIREEDIRADVFALGVTGNTDAPCADMTLAAGSHRNLKPEYLCAFICGKAAVPYEPHKILTVRKRLILDNKGE